MNNCLYCLLILSLVACQSEKNPSHADQENTVKVASSTFALMPGDLLFQDSDCGPFCESIEQVTTGIQGAEFSHVGLVVPSKTDELLVLEAITAGVVLTPLDSFFNRSFDENTKSKVVVGRMKSAYQRLIPDAIDFARSKLGYAYDQAFDITNDEYYCSELIYEAFRAANRGKAIFQLESMTYKDPSTQTIFPIWEEYFKNLDVPVPEGKPGLNPGGMSKSSYLDIVHFYGKPAGYQGNAHLVN